MIGRAFDALLHTSVKLLRAGFKNIALTLKVVLDQAAAACDLQNLVYLAAFSSLGALDVNQL